MPQEITSFEDALKHLQIPEFHSRIWHSNSRGELFFILDYINIANLWKGSTDLFRELFLLGVKDAEETWKRPESVFQHLFQMLPLMADKHNKMSELSKAFKNV